MKDDINVPLSSQTQTSYHQDEPIYDLPPPIAPEIPQHRRPAHVSTSATQPQIHEQPATRANSATQTNESKKIQTDSYDDYQSQETLSYGLRELDHVFLIPSWFYQLILTNSFLSSFWVTFWRVSIMKK